MSERRLESLDLRALWSVLVRRKRMVIATTGVFLALGVCLNIFMPRIYRASIRLVIQQPLDRSPLTGQTFGGSNFQSENLTMLTAAGQITTRRLLDQVAAEFDTHGWIQSIPTVAWKPPGGMFAWLHTSSARAGTPSAFTVSPAEREAQIDWLQTIVSVQPVQDTRFVDLKVLHNDPEAARVIADRLAQLFVADQRQRSVQADTSGLLYLDEELAQMKSRMRAGDPEAGGVDRLAANDARVRQATQDITELSAEQIRTHDELVATDARITRLLDETSTDRTTDATPALQSAIRDLQVNEQQLTAARQVYKDKHPKLEALEAQNAQLQQAYREERTRAVAGLRTERAVLAAREAGLNARIAQNERDLANAQAESQRLMAVSTDLKTNQDLYGLLAAKLQQGRIEGLMKAPPVEIVDAATLDPNPVQPRKTLNMLVSLFTGLFVGAGLALVRDSSRRTIREPRDVEDQLDLPLVGVVPREG